MQKGYALIAVDRIGDVFAVRLPKKVADHQFEELGAELGRLLDEENCLKMVLNLGPEEPECLTSLFLAKLISLQRRLDGMHGKLALAHASTRTRDIFRAAGIEKYFHFHPDQQSALQALVT
jgi:anti-anti-sigma regulatory factor